MSYGSNVPRFFASLLTDVWATASHALRVTIAAGAALIGQVRLQDGTGATLAKVGATTAAVAEGDNVLGVQAPVLGITTGAAVTTDAAGTLQQYFRGLITTQVPVLGAISGAAVTTDANGSLQQYLRGLVASLIPVAGAISGAAVITDANGTLQQYLRGLVKIFADLWDSTQHGLRIADDANIADYANIMKANGGAVIADQLWYQVSTGDLTIGTRYELQLYSTVPSDVGILRWVTKAAAGDPGVVTGRMAFLHGPIIVVPKTGHVRLYVQAITTATSWGNGTGYYAALEPCE